MLRQGCSLSMLHRTCENVHGVLGWVDWACPISCAYLFILSPGVLRNTLSHIWCKLILPIFLLRVGLLNGFFNCSGNAMVLPLYYLEVVLGGVASIVTVLVYRGGFLKVFFESFSKDPRGLPYVLTLHTRSPHWNQQMVPLLFSMGSLSLGETRRFLTALLPLKGVCMPYSLQILLILLHKP